MSACICKFSIGVALIRTDNFSPFSKNKYFSKNTLNPTSSLRLENGNNLNSYRLATAAIFRHRFKKKGRSLAMSAGYNNSLSDGTENLFSLNKFFQATTFTDQIRQLNTNENATQQVKSSLLFTEPLSKKWYWETFYNLNSTQNEVRRQVNDPEKNNERVDKLSIFYDNMCCTIVSVRASVMHTKA